MKLMKHILTGAAISACLLTFAGCGETGTTAPADSQPAASSAAEPVPAVQVTPSGTELTIDQIDPAAVKAGDVISGSVTVTDGQITAAASGCEIDGQDYAADTERWFNKMPSKKRGTLRPALVKDGAVLVRGIAQGGM